jgi:hypothetical protein
MDQSLNETEPQTTMAADTKPKATVLVPLYIYPLDEETWKPLYEAYVWPNLLPSRPQSPDLGLILILSNHHTQYSHLLKIG